MNFFLILSLLLSSSFLHAQDDKKPIPIESVEEKLLNKKAKRLTYLKSAYSSYQKKQYSNAASIIKPMASNPEYGDYYFYLSGLFAYEQMKKNYDEGKTKSAHQYAESAIRNLKEVMNANPYTALERRSNLMMGLAEVYLGDLFFKQKLKARARQLFETGFQRLAEANLLVMMPSWVFRNYGKLCDSKPDEICTSWEFKLASHISKDDKSKVFPRLSSVKIQYADRKSTATYKTELDLQAFQDGFKKFMEGKNAEAYSMWDELLTKYPRTSIKLRTKFWMGRAAQKSKQTAKAETLYREVIKEIPFSYYALVASWYSNIDILRMIDSTLPMAVSDAQLLSPTDLVHIKRAETFISSGVPELARLELKDVKPKSDMPNEYLVYLAMINSMADNHVLTFQIFSELGNRGYNGFFSSFGEKLLFPISHMKVIEENSKTYKLDPYMILSLIKQESAFNPEAMSTSNALGLMQIIPPTARDLDSNIEILDLFNPDKSVSLGTKYVRQLLKRYSGDIILALSAYNAGPGNADRWKNDASHYSGITPEERIELISFRETHDYVQNILRNYYWYNRRVRAENFNGFDSLFKGFENFSNNPGNSTSAQ